MADVYAVVDMSKKKKNRSLAEQESPLYTMVEKSNFSPGNKNESQVITSTVDSKSEDAPKAVNTTFTSRQRREKTIAKGRQPATFVYYVFATAVALLVLALVFFASTGVIFVEVNKLRPGTEVPTVQQPSGDND